MLIGKSNSWSFVFSVFCLMLSLYAMYTVIHQTWSAAPPLFVLWGLSVVAFVWGISGFKDKRNGLSKLKSWLTVIIAFPLSAVLLMGLVVNLFAKEPIRIVHSPEGDYTIHLYTKNGGAATSINVTGVLDGPLWFRKIIYDDMDMHKADVEWIDSHTVSINNHILDLKEGETFSD